MGSFTSKCLCTMWWGTRHPTHIRSRIRNTRNMRSWYLVRGVNPSTKHKGLLQEGRVRPGNAPVLASFLLHSIHDIQDSAIAITSIFHIYQHSSDMGAHRLPEEI